MTNWVIVFFVDLAIAAREIGQGVLHFYKQFVKQVNKVSCVTIKQRHLGKKKLHSLDDAWWCIFIISNFFWIIKKYEGMVHSLKYTILSSLKTFNVWFKEIDILFQFNTGVCLFNFARQLNVYGIHLKGNRETKTNFKLITRTTFFNNTKWTELIE